MESAEHAFPLWSWLCPQQQVLTATETIIPGAAGTGPAARQQQGLAKVIPISRANNVSIMLTQFSSFRAGPHGIRRALVTGTALSLERLSLLLQARCLPQHVLRCRQSTNEASLEYTVPVLIAMSHARKMLPGQFT